MKKILVIGESCWDTFVYGGCERLAPDAPVPVFNTIKTSRNMGMAGNVYTNIQHISNFQVGLRSGPNWESVTKTRYIDDTSNHMFLRVDEGDKNYERCDIESLNYMDYDAVVISDYDKGFLSELDIETICRNHPLTFLDTKKVLGRWVYSATYIKLNSYESRNNVPKEIREKIEDKLISTQGPKGCFFKGERFYVKKVDIRDVAGAGDTFLAALVCKYLETNNIIKAIQAGNKAATDVVQQRGVSVPRNKNQPMFNGNKV
tara:strand:+ start:10487 stop:11266 length:780 start_codon:yes stop_codon:yes gene_type:complete